MSTTTDTAAPRTFASVAANRIDPKTPSVDNDYSQRPSHNKTQDARQPTHPQSTSSANHKPPTPRSISPDQEPVYVLTLLTDKTLHQQMTDLRQTYFPPHLNKLDAHLTLFHALPARHLETDIVPRLEHTASQTSPFALRAHRLFRLRKGIAVAICREQGGAAAERVHAALRDEWRGRDFLSEQDRSDVRLHYTIMNKVDDEGSVANAFDDLRRAWSPRWGEATGLGLWLYDRGYWVWRRGFMFQG